MGISALPRQTRLYCSYQQGPESSHLPLSTTTLLNTFSSHNLVMKHLPGADPELVLLGHRYEELEVRPWEVDRGPWLETAPGGLTPIFLPLSESHSAK